MEMQISKNKQFECENAEHINFLSAMIPVEDESKYEGGQTRIIQKHQSYGAQKYLRTSLECEKEPLKPKSKQQIIENTEEQNESVSIHRFFKYNNKRDCIMLTIGTIGALIAGILIPSISMIMGSVADAFGSNSDVTQMSKTIENTAKWIALVAASIFFFGYIFFAFWQHLAENISLKLRKLYLNALLKQEVAFFEKTQIEQIPAQMGEIFQTIHRSIGEQYANLLFAMFNAIGGCIFAFISGPELASYLIAYLPVFFLILGTFGILVKNSTGERLDAIKQMGGVVSEILYAIKVVISFGREKQELEKFCNYSEQANNIGKKYQRRYSFMVAIMKFAIFSFYTFSFYVGSLFVQNQRINSANNLPYDSKTVLTVLIALITGFLSLIAALPHIQGIQAAKLAGKTIFNVIDRKPMIDNCLDPIINFTLQKQIDFQNVSFKYPTAAPEQRNVLNNVSFTIKAGESTAIVGPSGSGKSTIVQLIERFYDPIQNIINQQIGSISFDQVDIKTIRLKELRESIGYVPQEPTMIIGTIKENLLFGNKDATDQQINEALLKANAQFVYDFEMKLDTFIGTSSVVNLSGGQKQRLAIARALLKNPKILILDEATSALDPQSEKEVQDAIEQIENLNANEQEYQPLTILIIAHRLSSITSAKNLLYLESRDKIKLYQKGTEDYLNAMNRLKNFTYAYGKGEEEEFEREKINLIKEQSILEKSLINSKIQIEEINEGDNNIKTQINKNFLLQRSNQQSLQLENQNEKNESTVQEQQQITNIDEFLEEELKTIPRSQIMKYYNPKWLAVVGIVSSMISSVQLPVFGFLLSKMVFLMQNFKSNVNFESERDFWIIMFQVMCTGLFVFTFLQKYAFGYGSENLTNKIRIELFEAILYKHIGWFDDKNRAPGILGNIIQEDISLLNGLTSEVYGVALESLIGLIVSSAMCLYFSWQVGLIAIVLSPLMVFGGFFMSSFQWAQGKVDDQYKESNALLSDIIMNYRTIISLGEKNIDFILEKYYNLLDKPNKEGIKRAHFSGILYGYSQSVRFIFVGVSFYLASLIIENSKDPNEIRNNVFTAVYIMFVGAIGAGVAVSQMPSMARAQQSASKIFSIINESSMIDSRNNINLVQINKIQQGQIQIKNINFKYPSRQKLVLNDFNLTINGNESVALVGHSGSGKSTIASLLLRFYDKQKGKIIIDGLEIEKYPVKYIRDQIAIVMQEPLLFNESIKNNIKYGNLDATDIQVLEAAEQANCLDFIQKSEDQFQRKEIKLQIQNDFDQIINILSLEYPNIVGLKILANELLIEEIFLLKELLELVNNNALQQINNNIQIFIDDVILKLSKSETLLTHTWKTLLMDFIWKINAFPFLQSIIQKNEQLLINKKSSAFQNISDYLLMNPWKIDQIALEEYFQIFNNSFDDCNRKISNSFCVTQDQYKIIDFSQDQSKKDLLQSKYIRNSVISQSLNESQYSIINFLGQYKDQQRINNIYEKILRSLIDFNKINQKRGVLHPGFEKLCGLRGSKLSGGQKQRVAIARALIRNPRILILDEATSALDEKSQEIVQQALERAMKGRTSIVIAHRLSTVKKCDKIIVLHNGKVVEQGTYNQLCQDSDSYFFKLKAGLQVDN